MDLGCTLRRLPEEPDLPDSVFVEDAAVVLDNLAVITRPGTSQRRDETLSVAAALTAYRPLYSISAPGTLDGGDVLQVGRILYVGLSTRSNSAGIKQLGEIIAAHGYALKVVDVHGCLHLKSAVTHVGDETLLINGSWVNADSFDGLECIDVDPGESYAANALLIGDALVYPQSFPRTCHHLENRGIAVNVIDVSEVQKADGALTCCSIIFDVTRLE